MRRNRGFGGGLTAVAIGAGLTYLASRVIPPIAGRAVGSARVAMGGDPFDALARDHQRVLGMIDKLLASGDSARVRRRAGLFQIKRALTAHALAEEDVIYPMLREKAGAEEAASRLYREHAELKVSLFRLEHMAADDTAWRQELQALRDLIARHAEDEERTEFPKLRAALSKTEISQVSADVGQEKQLVL